MKIGIIGGSFNPPHQGHLHLSKLALQKLELDWIWWIPTKKNPLKNSKDYESYAARIQKCRNLVGNHPKIKILLIDEIYSEKLLTRLQKKYPQNHFYFVVGADILAHFHRWKNFRKIITKIDLAIFAREDFLLKIQKFPAWKFIKAVNRFRIFFTAKNTLSSTQIRKLSSR
jgi:nicotinate-nucleotide adenylyltransferase